MRTAPARVLRQRTRGWRTPLDAQGRKAVYVGRGSKWGNPCRIGIDADDHAHATALYRQWLLTNDVTIHNSYVNDERRDWILAHLPELTGRDLMCWCPVTDKDGSPLPCHADVLLEIANSPRST